MYMDDITLFAKNDREFETLIQTVKIYSQYIGMKFGIEKWTMLVMKSGKQHVTEKTNGRIKKNQNSWRKENLQILTNIGN